MNFENEDFESSGLYENQEKLKYCWEQIGVAFLNFIPSLAEKLQITNDECFSIFRAIYEETFYDLSADDDEEMEISLSL